MKNFYGVSRLIIMGSMIIFLTNCIEDNSSRNRIQNVTGYAQKGPFINGSSVTVYDLESDLTPTGKSYDSQITDNKGTFQLNDITLSSNYVNIRADGFYFNEISGRQSAAKITLYALSDILGKTDINVNVLTDLERMNLIPVQPDISQYGITDMELVSTGRYLPLTIQIMLKHLQR